MHLSSKRPTSFPSLASKEYPSLDLSRLLVALKALLFSILNIQFLVSLRFWLRKNLNESPFLNINHREHPPDSLFSLLSMWLCAALTYSGVWCRWSWSSSTVVGTKRHYISSNNLQTICSHTHDSAHIHSPTAPIFSQHPSINQCVLVFWNFPSFEFNSIPSTMETLLFSSPPPFIRRHPNEGNYLVIPATKVKKTTIIALLLLLETKFQESHTTLNHTQTTHFIILLMNLNITIKEFSCYSSKLRFEAHTTSTNP